MDDKPPTVTFKRMEAPWAGMTPEQIREALEIAYGQRLDEDRRWDAPK